mmetsp:Transcript_22265/g.52917  ORF Transcript_22265/g.52917 Transcript_22265/m.52917 type:complete len:390 (-) Transcript_22265:1634-2803(-)
MTIVFGSQHSHQRGTEHVHKVLVISEPEDEDSDRRKTNVNSDDHVTEEHPVVNEGIVFSTGWLEHNVRIGRIEPKGGGGRTVGDQVDPQQLNRNKSFGTPDGRREKDRQNLSNVGRNHVPDEGLHVGVDRSSLLDGCDNRREVVVRQNHVRCLLGDLSSCNTHSNTDGSLLQSGSIVDTVPGHRRDLSARSEELDQQLLVAGFGSGKDARAATLHDELGALLVTFGVLKEFGAGEGLAGNFLIGFEDADVASDRLGGDLVVARDHDDTDAGILTALDGRANLWSGRILDTGESDKGQSGLDLVIFVDVKKLRWELFLRGHASLDRHSEDTEGTDGHVGDAGRDRVAFFRRQGLDGPIGAHDGGASLQEQLGGSLDVENAVARVLVLAKD